MIGRFIPVVPLGVAFTVCACMNKKEYCYIYTHQILIMSLSVAGVVFILLPVTGWCAVYGQLDPLFSPNILETGGGGGGV